MAERVYLHIGLPKTATSYLQTIVWSARDQLRAEGLLLPGRERRDHLWASRVIREDPHLGRPGRPRDEPTAWQRLLAEIEAWDGAALVSHEFFAAASAEQARRMIADLAPTPVEVLITAREPLGLFTASWQESLKNRATRPLDSYSRTVSERPMDIWNWRTLDLRLVLERWGDAVPWDQMHVLPLDTTAERAEIWHRFGGLLGLDTGAYDLGASFPNESMGVVEAETLRRVNRHLGTFQRAFDKGVYIRSFLADERLVPRRGEKFWPDDDRIAECRERGEQAIAFVQQHPIDVVGDLEHLRVPAQLPPRRTPSSVTDAEVAEVATELVATLLGDVRELRTAKRAGDERGEAVSSVRRAWSRWRTRTGDR